MNRKPKVGKLLADLARQELYDCGDHVWGPWEPGLIEDPSLRVRDCTKCSASEYKHVTNLNRPETAPDSSTWHPERPA